MEFLGENLRDHQEDEQPEKERGAGEIAPGSRVIVTVSPPISPRVVAAILMTQKTRVTSGTLLIVERRLRSWPCIIVVSRR